MKNSKIKFSDLLIYEDDDLMLVNKPPFLSTLEDRHEKVNLLGLAKDYLSDAQVCHRLDKDTSGVLAIAKHPEAYRHMSIQFEKRLVNKIYHAVVDGVHSFKEEDVNLPILKLEDGTVRISKKDGKPAQTFFTSITPYKSNTLVECRPVTGRMHQIRIHLATLGARITGDVVYGGKLIYLSSLKRGFNLKKGSEELPLMQRMALHAFSLEFNDLSGKSQKIDAPYPKDFSVLVRQLDVNR